MRFHKKIVSNVTFALAAGVAITMTSAAFALGAREAASIALDTPAQRVFQNAKHDIPRLYEDNCHANQLQTELNECVYGAKDGELSLVLFGDSHAAHWFPPLEAIAKKHNLQLITMTKSACPSAMFEPFNKNFGRNYTECTVWRRNVFRRLSEIRPDFVVISNSNKYVPETRNTADEWEQAMRLTLDELTPHSQRVIVIRDTPRANTNVPDCLSHAQWQGRNPIDSCFMIRRTGEEVFLAEKNASKYFSEASVVDITHLICHESKCPVYFDQVVKLSDAHHLTKTFSLSLMTEIETLLFADKQDFVQFTNPLPH